MGLKTRGGSLFNHNPPHVYFLSPPYVFEILFAKTYENFYTLMKSGETTKCVSNIDMPPLELFGLLINNKI